MITKTEARRLGHLWYNGKECSVCGLTERFVGNDNCKTCRPRVAARAGRTRRERAERTGAPSTYEGKPCRHHGTTTRYRSSYGCVTCTNERTKVFRSRLSDEEKKRRNRIAKFKAYGLTLADVQDLESRQDGKCAICKRPGDIWAPGNVKAKEGAVRPLVIDHCHKTGKVRGLLCVPCNLTVQNHLPELLIAAAEYVERHAA